MLQPRNLSSLPSQHPGERGAALVTVLLISTLLLAAGGLLIVATSMMSTNTVDSTAELHAYYAAEAGSQRALGVLRGNDLASGTTKPNLRQAVLDPDMSTWVSYNSTIGGTPVMTVGSNGAYSINIIDPDDQGPVASRKITTDPNYIPSRVLIQATGYGPRGSRKQFEVMLNRNSFDFAANATITFIGAPGGVPPVNVTTGDSSAKNYSGHDRSSLNILPTFGVTNTPDELLALAACNKNTVADPKTGVITNSSLPTWLQSADNARAFLAEMQGTAVNMDRYFTSFSGNAGSTSSPQMTFVDGNCDLDGGAGLLIVTGTLTMSGNPSFDGLILVLGDGIVERSGGGDGTIAGAMVVAKFDRPGPGDFKAPTFNTNGGGNSTFVYDSSSVNKALQTLKMGVVGVREL